MPIRRSPETRPEIPAEQVPSIIVFLEGSSGITRVEGYMTQTEDLMISRSNRNGTGEFFVSHQFDETQVQEGLDWFRERVRRLRGAADLYDFTNNFIRLNAISSDIRGIIAARRSHHSPK